MGTIDVDGGNLLDMTPKPDMDIKVILVIDGQDVARYYRAADISEIDWKEQMEDMADTILAASDDAFPEPPKGNVSFGEVL